MKISKVLCAVLALAFASCLEYEYGGMPDTTIPSLGTPDNNEIWFVTTDGRELVSLDMSAFDAPISDVIYAEEGVNVIRFAEKVTTIGDEAFRGCTNIFNLSLPNSVAKIGKRAFYDCKNMECLTFGEGLTRCEEMAFDGCINLLYMHIPSIYNWCRISFESPTSNPLYYTQSFMIDGERVRNMNILPAIQHISDYAFYNNSYLTSVNIPASLQTVGKKAFYGCDGIEKVDIKSISAWCAIEFEDEVSNPLTIAQVLYLDGKKVTNLSLSAVEEVAQYTFMNCTTIKSLEADNTLTNINTDAFRNCSALTSVSLGSGVEEIDEQAFWNCAVLKSVTCRALTPPTLDGEGVFELNATNRKFYVPSEALELYKSDDMWRQYSADIEAIL